MELELKLALEERAEERQSILSKYKNDIAHTTEQHIRIMILILKNYALPFVFTIMNNIVIVNDILVTANDANLSFEFTINYSKWKGKRHSDVFCCSWGKTPSKGFYCRKSKSRIVVQFNQIWADVPRQLKAAHLRCWTFAREEHSRANSEGLLHYSRRKRGQKSFLNFIRLKSVNGLSVSVPPTTSSSQRELTHMRMNLSLCEWDLILQTAYHECGRTFIQIRIYFLQIPRINHKNVSTESK